MALPCNAPNRLGKKTIIFLLSFNFPEKEKVKVPFQNSDGSRGRPAKHVSGIVPPHGREPRAARALHAARTRGARVCCRDDEETGRRGTEPASAVRDGPVREARSATVPAKRMDVEAARNQTGGDSSRQTPPDLTALKLAVRAKPSPPRLRQSRPAEPAAGPTQTPSSAPGDGLARGQPGSSVSLQVQRHR